MAQWKTSDGSGATASVEADALENVCNSGRFGRIARWAERIGDRGGSLSKRWRQSAARQPNPYERCAVCRSDGWHCRIVQKYAGRLASGLGRKRELAGYRIRRFLMERSETLRCAVFRIR